MKHLSILILLLFFASEVNAQWQPSDASAVGKRKEMENTQTYKGKAAYALHPSLSYEVNSAPMEVMIDSIARTVSTETDSITFTAKFKQTFEVFAVDDTMQISLDRTFTNARIVYPWSVSGYYNFNPVTFPKVYIKRYGTTGTVTYNYASEGF